jgi:hypothetical protein
MMCHQAISHSYYTYFYDKKKVERKSTQQEAGLPEILAEPEMLAAAVSPRISSFQCGDDSSARVCHI